MFLEERSEMMEGKDGWNGSHMGENTGCTEIIFCFQGGETQYNQNN